MPLSPGNACKHIRCINITKNKNGYCDEHKPVATRPSTHARGYGKRWLKLRKWYVSKYPMCEKCNEKPTEEVHHIISLRERPDLLLAIDNLTALCLTCHNKEHRGH